MEKEKLLISIFSPFICLFLKASLFPSLFSKLIFLRAVKMNCQEKG